MKNMKLRATARRDGTNNELLCFRERAKAGGEEYKSNSALHDVLPICTAVILNTEKQEHCKLTNTNKQTETKYKKSKRPQKYTTKTVWIGWWPQSGPPTSLWDQSDPQARIGWQRGASMLRTQGAKRLRQLTQSQTGRYHYLNKSICPFQKRVHMY